MSATNRGTQRVERDDYPSPAWAVRALVQGILALDNHDQWGGLPATLLDPCAGNGGLLAAIKSYLSTLTPPDRIRFRSFAIEINPAHGWALSREAGHYLIGNALSAEAAVWARQVDWIVTNPPYGKGEDLAREFVETWRERATLSAWLVRLNWLGSQERSSFLRAWMPDTIVLPRRPSFVAVCKGQPARKTAIRVRGCGATYPLGARGKCACGGTIGDGTDACEYAWAIWRPKTRGQLIGKNLIADLDWCKSE